MSMKPSEVHVYWKKRTESLESLKLGTILKNPSVDEDSGLSGVQNIGVLPPIPFNSAIKIDVFYQSVSSAGKKRRIAWLETNVYKTIQDSGGIDDDQTTITLDSITNLIVGDLLKIEAEIVEITQLSPTLIERGQHGTSGAAHTQYTKCMKLVPSVPYNSKILDGRTDSLSTPGGLVAVGASGSIKLYWTAYTGLNRKLLRHYCVYRNTTTSPPSTPLAEVDADFFVDPVPDDDVYYYWVSSVDICGNESSKSSIASAQAQMFQSDPDVSNAPVIAVICEKTSDGKYRYTFGAEIPTQNAVTAIKTQFQIARDSGFNDIVSDVTLGVPDNYQWITAEITNFYFRARVCNIVGWSDWSTTTIRGGENSLEGSEDTDIPSVPLNVAALVDDYDSSIPGLEMRVEWDRPASNFHGIFSYAVQLYGQSTFPDHVQLHAGTVAQYGSGVSFGGLTLTDDTMTFDSGDIGKNIWFHNNASRSDASLRSTAMILTVPSAHVVTFDRPCRMDPNLGSVYWQIIVPNWEQVIISKDVPTTLIPQHGNIGNADKFQVTFTNLGLGTFYARVAAANAFGIGPWCTSVGPRVIDGFKTGDYKASSVDNAALDDGSVDGPKIVASSVTAGKIDVDYLSAINTDLGTILAGLVIGATVETATSGPRSVMDSGGLRVYGSGGTLIFNAAIASDYTFVYKLNATDEIAGNGRVTAGTYMYANNYINTGGDYRVNSNTVISSARNFVGVGVDVGSGELAGGTLKLGSTTLSESQLQTIKTHCGA